MMRAGLRAVTAMVATGFIGQAYAQGTTTPTQPSGYGLKDGTTLAIAILGAVLGILNYWNAVKARRVRLRVTPTDDHSDSDFASPPVIGIKIVNLSNFAVTVAEVGLMLEGITKPSLRLRPMLNDGKPWPRRLESREAVTAYVERREIGQYPVSSVYALLASGERIAGKGRVLDGMRAG